MVTASATMTGPGRHGAGGAGTAGDHAAAGAGLRQREQGPVPTLCWPQWQTQGGSTRYLRTRSSPATSTATVAPCS